MDYSKIRLANERNSHVTKRLNRLSTWKFFKVIYRENIWRMFGYNFLMLICMVPLFAVMLWGRVNVSTITNTLPMYQSFGFSTGGWFAGSTSPSNVTEYLARRIRQGNMMTGVWMTVAALAFTFILSGGFAVIRDSFWTGKMSTVGVFRSMWKGIKANILYALASTALIALSIFGIYELHIYIAQIAGIKWLAIIVTIILSIAEMLFVTYLLILCSVSLTYKQKLGENLDDAWRLMWLNIFPNIIHLLIALIPVALYFIFGRGVMFQIFLILMLMFGGMYFPLVWQTHMMKTFALFHPVEIKKKKKTPVEKSDKLNKDKGSKHKNAADVDDDADEITDEMPLLAEPQASEALEEPTESAEEPTPDEAQQDTTEGDE